MFIMWIISMVCPYTFLCASAGGCFRKGFCHLPVRACVRTKISYHPAAGTGWTRLVPGMASIPFSRLRVR